MAPQQLAGRVPGDRIPEDDATSDLFVVGNSSVEILEQVFF